jgi:hypothetical protein
LVRVGLVYPLIEAALAVILRGMMPQLVGAHKLLLLVAEAEAVLPLLRVATAVLVAAVLVIPHQELAYQVKEIMVAYLFMPQVRVEAAALVLLGCMDSLVGLKVLILGVYILGVVLEFMALMETFMLVAVVLGKGIS